MKLKYFDTEQVVAMGQRIKIARVDAGLTQRQVAEELGKTPEMVIRIEKGRSACTTDHIFILCQLFNISPDYLFYGKESKDEDLGKKYLDLDIKITDLLNQADDFEKDKIYRMIQLMLEQQPA